MGWNEFESRKLIDEYQQAGILERHEVANPNNPDRPVAAVKLVRTNETVRRALGSATGRYQIRSWRTDSVMGRGHACCEGSGE